MQHKQQRKGGILVRRGGGIRKGGREMKRSRTSMRVKTVAQSVDQTRKKMWRDWQENENGSTRKKIRRSCYQIIIAPQHIEKFHDAFVYLHCKTQCYCQIFSLISVSKLAFQNQKNRMRHAAASESGVSGVFLHAWLAVLCKHGITWQQQSFTVRIMQQMISSSAQKVCCFWRYVGFTISKHFCCFSFSFN